MAKMMQIKTVKTAEDEFRIEYSFSTVHSVIEIESKKMEIIDEIDMSLVCDDYDF